MSVNASVSGLKSFTASTQLHQLLSGAYFRKMCFESSITLKPSSGTHTFDCTITTLFPCGTAFTQLVMLCCVSEMNGLQMTRKGDF